MVMILQFKGCMDRVNKFFRKVYSSPAILWKGFATLIFITIGLAILIVPSLTGGDNTIRTGFGGMITVYGLYRFWTFYMDVKNLDDAE